MRVSSTRSCLSNLLAFEEAVTRMIDESHTVDVIYLDFAKAFDSVNHRFLFSFGLGDVVVSWIEAYFSGRVSGHSNAQRCSTGLRDRPTPVSTFRKRPLRCPRNNDVALCG